MSYHALFAGLAVLTALASILNERLFKLPKTIGLTLLSVALSIAMMILVKFKPEYFTGLHDLLIGIDFKTTILDVMLGYLLFASSLHINSIDLKKEFRSIIYLASVGVIVSTAAIGFSLHYLSIWLHHPINIFDCLIFGALISPTDPIAVLSVFKTSPHVPAKVKTRITGEALFNDAAGILLLFTLVGIFYSSKSDVTINSVSHLLVTEVGGGIVFGIIVGMITSWLLKFAVSSETIILTTIGASSAGYIIATNLHFSAAIAMVIAGLIVGINSKKEVFSQATTMTLNSFWEMIDDILNSFIFVLIGLELLEINVSYYGLLFGFVVMVMLVIIRYASISVPNYLLHIALKDKERNTWTENLLMSWGGIRGGISVALAMSIPELPSTLLTITYSVVLMSIIIQGSTFKMLVNYFFPEK